MAQVVTNENMEQLIKTGAVEDFKPPEAPPVQPVVAAEPEAAIATDDGTVPDDPKKFAKRMAEKHAAMKDAEEFADLQYRQARAAEKRAEELEDRLKALESKAAPAPEKAAKPDPKDFKDAFEYAESLAEYKANEAIAAERKRQAVEQEQAALEQRKREFVSRINAVRKDVPDFDEVLAGADVKILPHIEEFIVESDDGPRIAYHFARNPAELERISQLSPFRAVAELGKIEAQLEKPGKVVTMTEGKTVAQQNLSKAPAPIEPLAASATTSQQDPSKMDTRTFLEYRRQQRKLESQRPRKVHH